MAKNLRKRPCGLALVGPHVLVCDNSERCAQLACRCERIFQDGIAQVREGHEREHGEVNDTSVPAMKKTRWSAEESRFCSKFLNEGLNLKVRYPRAYASRRLREMGFVRSQSAVSHHIDTQGFRVIHSGMARNSSTRIECTLSPVPEIGFQTVAQDITMTTSAHETMTNPSGIVGEESSTVAGILTEMDEASGNAGFVEETRELSGEMDSDMEMADYTRHIEHVNIVGRVESEKDSAILNHLEHLLNNHIRVAGEEYCMWEERINFLTQAILAGRGSAEHKTMVMALVSDFLLAVNSPAKRRRVRRPNVDPTPIRRKDRKKFEYKKQRQAWKRNRAKVANDILNGKRDGCLKPSEIHGFSQYWQSTFHKVDDDAFTTENMSKVNDGYDVWKPISKDDVSECRGSMALNSACGPDGISVEALKGMKIHVLCKLMNILMYLGKVPEILKKSRTIFIPKKDLAASPREYRPLSLTSVVLRLFNKILAKRVGRVAKFDHRQRAFQKLDGCAENIMLLESIIVESRRRFRSLYLANLDITNAYGSCEHSAIIKALTMNGGNSELVEYVRDLYTGFVTEICVGERSDPVLVERGVLQGDPLSPILFNMIIDQLLAKIPCETGFKLNNEVSTNGMAFADDLNLIASTKPGLALALRLVEENGKCWGLEFNQDKCQYMALESSRGKVWKVNNQLEFGLSGGRIKATEYDDVWRYLGAFYSARGLRSAPDMLDTWLSRLKSARFLRPQEKLYVLRVHLIPRLVFRLCMANLDTKKLNVLDRKIRQACLGEHGFVHLPLKVPVAFFHAPVKSGGLGLMRLRHSIPSMVLSRFGRLQDSPDVVLRTAANLFANVSRVHKAERILVTRGETVGNSSARIRAINTMDLLDTNCGKGLKHAVAVPYVHNWVSDASLALTGTAYCNALKLRVEALPCRVRTARASNGEYTCKAGCPSAETNYHQVQECVRSHGMRIKRHDRVVDILIEGLKKAGYSTERMPRLRSSGYQVRCPDIIAIKDEEVHVIDPTIVGDRDHPDIWHDNKVSYYSNSEACVEVLGERYPNKQVYYGALAVTYKGIISPKSAEYLRSLGVVKRILKRITMATIRGSLLCHWATNVSNLKYYNQLTRRR